MLARLKTPTATFGSDRSNPALMPSDVTSRYGGSLNPSNGMMSLSVLTNDSGPANSIPSSSRNTTFTSGFLPGASRNSIFSKCRMMKRRCRSAGVGTARTHTTPGRSARPRPWWAPAPRRRAPVSSGRWRAIDPASAWAGRSVRQPARATGRSTSRFVPSRRRGVSGRARTGRSHRRGRRPPPRSGRLGPPGPGPGARVRRHRCARRRGAGWRRRWMCRGRRSCPARPVSAFVIAVVADSGSLSSDPIASMTSPPSSTTSSIASRTAWTWASAELPNWVASDVARCSRRCRSCIRAVIRLSDWDAKVGNLLGSNPSASSNSGSGTIPNSLALIPEKKSAGLALPLIAFVEVAADRTLEARQSGDLQIRRDESAGAVALAGEVQLRLLGGLEEHLGAVARKAVLRVVRRVGDLGGVAVAGERAHRRHDDAGLLEHRGKGRVVRCQIGRRCLQERGLDGVPEQ